MSYRIRKRQRCLHVCQEGRRRQLAGNLTRRRAAHSIADDKQALLWLRCTEILVAASHAPDIRKHREAESLIPLVNRHCAEFAP